MAVDEDACMSLYSQELFSVHFGLDEWVTANNKRKKMSPYLGGSSAYQKQRNNLKTTSSSRFCLTNLFKWKQNVCLATKKPRCTRLS